MGSYVGMDQLARSSAQILNAGSVDIDTFEDLYLLWPSVWSSFDGQRSSEYVAQTPSPVNTECKHMPCIDLYCWTRTGNTGRENVR